MGRTTNMAFVAQDQVTPAINSMRASTQRFSKDTEETTRQMQALQTKQNAMGDGYKKLQVNLDDTKNALQKAKKEYKEMGDEVSKTNLENAYGEYNKAKDAVKEWDQELKNVRKSIQELSDEQSRAANRANSGGSLAGSFAQMGLTQMMGDTLSNAANVAIGSAFGDAAGSAISSTISGAMSGAAMGSMLGAPGMLVGAAIGGLSGAANAAINNFAKEDEAFKSVRNDLVQNALQDQQSKLDSSVGIAMGREKTNVQLRHQFGDDELAQEYLDNTINLANQTPFYYTDLIGVGATYKAFGYQNEELYEEQLRIANAAAIRGWDASTMESVASTLGYTQQSGKVSLQQVKQLQMKGLNVPRYLAIAGSDIGDELSPEEILSLINASDEELSARGVNLSEDDIYAMISKGQIDGKQAARAISDYMAIEFEGGAAKLADTYYGLSSTLGGLDEQMLSYMGEGYAEERKKGLEEQIDWLSNDGGDSMAEAYSLIGQWEASLDNSKEQMERDIMSAVMSGNAEALSGDYSDDQIDRITKLAADYQSAMAEENGAEAGKILAEAQIEAQAAYNASEGAQVKAASERQLVNDVTSMLAADKTYWNAGYLMGQEMSKGQAAAMLEGFDFTSSGIGTSGAMEEDNAYITARKSIERSSGNNHAYGLPYVPYDNYPINAHRGERLLTASEARTADRKADIPPVQISGTFNVREETDIYKIAQELVRELQKAQMVT